MEKMEGYEVKYEALEIIYKKVDELLDTKTDISLKQYSVKLLYEIADKIKSLEV